MGLDYGDDAIEPRSRTNLNDRYQRDDHQRNHDRRGRRGEKDEFGRDVDEFGRAKDSKMHDRRERDRRYETDRDRDRRYETDRDRDRRYETDRDRNYSRRERSRERDRYRRDRYPDEKNRYSPDRRRAGSGSRSPTRRDSPPVHKKQDSPIAQNTEPHKETEGYSIVDGRNMEVENANELDEEEQMRRIMGFSSFETTKNKKVLGADVKTQF
ncbi:hypothetical protein HDV01_002008 [Terramyces sp. JEL0728]|nr:hypothetical protein HDV01_002008 [Terramyces sp. JEL0728]